MNDPNSSIRVQEMRALVLLSKGHRQTEVARILGSHQPRIARIVKTLEHAYGVNLFSGATGAKRINGEGIALAARFEAALNALEGVSIEAEVRKKVASLKIALRDLSEIANSI